MISNILERLKIIQQQLIYRGNELMQKITDEYRQYIVTKAIFKAAKSGDLETLERLANDRSFNTYDWRNRSPFKWAILNEHDHISKFLIRRLKGAPLTRNDNHVAYDSKYLSDETSFLETLNKSTKWLTTYLFVTTMLLLMTVNVLVVPFPLSIPFLLAGGFGASLGVLIALVIRGQNILKSDFVVSLRATEIGSSFISALWHIVPRLYGVMATFGLSLLVSKYLQIKETPINLAIKCNNFDIYYKLTLCNVPRNITAELRLATQHGSSKLVRTIVLWENVSHDLLNECLATAVKRKDKKSAEYLLYNERLDLSQPIGGYTFPLHGLNVSHEALGDLLGAKKLIQVCLDPEQYTAEEVHAALAEAVEKRYAACVRLLLKSRKLDHKKVDEMWVDIEMLLKTYEHVHYPGVTNFMKSCFIYSNINYRRMALEEAYKRESPALVRYILDNTKDTVGEKLITFELLRNVIAHMDGSKANNNVANMILQDSRAIAAITQDQCKYFSNDIMPSVLRDFGNIWLPSIKIPPFLKLITSGSHNALFEKLIQSPSFIRQLWAKNGILLRMLANTSVATCAYLVSNVKFYGIPLLDLKISANKFIFQFQTLLLFSYTESYLKWVGIIKSKIQSVMLLKSIDAVQEYEDSLRNSEQHNTNADNQKYAAQAKHLVDTVKPKLISKIKEKYGDEYVSGIEAKIRENILEMALEHADKIVESGLSEPPSTKEAIAELKKSEKLLNLICEIKKNKQFETLIKGEDRRLMGLVSKILSSNEDIADIAWRGYDKFSPVLTGMFTWINLLVPQDGKGDIYSTVAVNVGRVTEKLGSELAREAVALTYYALIEGNETLSPEEHKHRMGHFVQRLAEIRRANSVGNDGLDSPSCLPGIFSRVAKLWDMDDSLSIAKSDRVVLEDAFRPIVLKCFKDWLDQCPDKLPEHEAAHNSDIIIKAELFEAIIGLRKETAQDVFTQPLNAEQDAEQDDEKPVDFERQADIREQFKKRVMKQLSYFERINYMVPSNYPGHCYRDLLINDLTGAWISSALTDVYVAAVPPVEHRRNDDALKNPFVMSISRRLILEKNGMHDMIAKQDRKAEAWMPLYTVLQLKEQGEHAEKLVDALFLNKEAFPKDVILDVLKSNHLIGLTPTAEEDIWVSKMVLAYHQATAQPAIVEDDGVGVGASGYTPAANDAGEERVGTTPAQDLGSDSPAKLPPKHL